jgi:hypothetical protein
MRWIRNFGVGMILMWLIGACLKQPELSIIPQITLQNVSFTGKASTTAKDTITISLGFSDGDGDLGINPDETAIYTGNGDSIDIQTPYYFLYDSTQPASSPWYTTHQNNLTSAYLASIGFPTLLYVNYGSFRKYKTTSPFDTLPALSCASWQVRGASQVAPIVKLDTLFIKNNPNSNNIFVTIYYTPNLGTPFSSFDPVNSTFSPQCAPNPWNGRFPVLSSNLGNNSPIQGTLTYKLQSYAFYAGLRGHTIKITVYITDRAEHKSNVVTSNDIVIPL